ncbi:MAG: hypothetical protein Q4D13_02320 [Erysipelotrichaceae bacterium]|nr:hypothetical protein [Erysipelotrichaceae bacterium]
MFNIVLGVPEFEKLWNDLLSKYSSNTLSKKEELLFRKLGKAMKKLSNNPKYPGLHTHEIKELTDRYKEKVFQSYLENNTPGAGRLYWVYGPGKNEITVIGVEPHPNDKGNSYKKIALSRKP